MLKITFKTWEKTDYYENRLITIFVNINNSYIAFGGYISDMQLYNFNKYIKKYFSIINKKEIGKNNRVRDKIKRRMITSQFNMEVQGGQLAFAAQVW
jgi:hypothetical protein